jgi:hypothetical protein
MQSLITYLEIPVDRMPSLEVDCAKVLIDTILPHLNDVEKASILANRSMKKKKIVFGSVIGSEVGGLVDDCLTPDAKAEMIDAAKAYAKAVEEFEYSSVAPKKQEPIKRKGWVPKICILQI